LIFDRHGRGRRLDGEEIQKREPADTIKRKRWAMKSMGFKVGKDLGARDEVQWLVANVPIARGAYRAAVKM
jgi:hypothetical protein